ncbi:MAG: M20 family metallopeptidase [Bacteroidetes bacterium]|nr:M20 family metallopeptidase [Bacteroidota bacterium]
MNDVLLNEIKTLSVQIHPDLVAIRRHLHQHPELSFDEHQTSAYIQKKLTEWGIPFTAGWVKTGVVAHIEGKNPQSKVVALRADMDALPITETKHDNRPYRSLNEGVMHACGHDAHTTCLLGAAYILQTTRKEWNGTVKLIFQPAEEKSPGGALLMLQQGALAQPPALTIIGQHVLPQLETGKVGFRPGLMMASCDEIILTIHGKGGHGATPQFCVDPILIAAQVLVGLQQIVSRFIDPTLPRVLTFGKINSVGGAHNVIPESVVILGTLRMMNEESRFETHKQIRKIASGIAESFGGHCEVEIDVGYPFLINDEDLTARTRAAAEAYLGPENIVDLPMRMTAEDFAYYSQIMPGCFYRIGTGNTQRGITASIHTPQFDIDEKALEIGAGLMAWLALNELK